MKTSLIINATNKKSKINKEIYGHFSEHLGRCIYDGFYPDKDIEIEKNKDGVRKDIIDALKEINIPVLRWPGGCFADEYHWRDGIGNKDERPKRINSCWGKIIENNHFGTHEFLDLCEELGCEPYIAGNLGSGTPNELAQWVEYMTYDKDSTLAEERKNNGREKPWKIKYLGIGNENWGGGGSMRPEYYADEYRRYSTFCKDYGESHLFKIACGPNVEDYGWTEGLMKNIGDRRADGISLHFYTVPTGVWDEKGSATHFSDEEYYSGIEKAYYMDELITNHCLIMDRYDKNHRVALIVDEWGVWCDPEKGTNPSFLYQQNSMRDAFVAAITLNIFNRHSDRVKMANLAQTVNVLQSVILTDGERMIKTPTYHIFNMYKAHQDSTLIDTVIDLPCERNIQPVSHSASVTSDGKLVLTIANPSLDKAYEIDCKLLGFSAKSANAQILTGKKDDYNTFDEPEKVHTSEFTDFEIKDDSVKINMPKTSIISIIFE